MKVLAEDVPSLEISLAAVFLGTQVFFAWVGFYICWSFGTWFLDGDLWCLGGLGVGHLGLIWLLTPHWWHMGVLGASHFFFYWTYQCGQFGLMCPSMPQWWHVGGFLLIGSLIRGWGLKATSPSITAFPLSILGGGDSGITGLTEMVLEVDGVSEIEVGTYPSPVLSVGHFWMESMWVSFSSETLSSCNCVSSSLSSKSLFFMRIEVFLVLRLFSSSTYCLYFSLSFRNSTYWSW
jgi:hypothetical protein